MWECKWIESLNPYKSDKIEKIEFSRNVVNHIEFKDGQLPYCVMLIDLHSDGRCQTEFFIGYIKYISELRIVIRRYARMKCPETYLLQSMYDFSRYGISKDCGITLIQDARDDGRDLDLSGSSFSVKVFECTKTAKENIQKFLDGE